MFVNPFRAAVAGKSLNGAILYSAALWEMATWYLPGRGGDISPQPDFTVQKRKEQYSTAARYQPRYVYSKCAHATQERRATQTTRVIGRQMGSAMHGGRGRHGRTGPK